MIVFDCYEIRTIVFECIEALRKEGRLASIETAEGYSVYDCEDVFGVRRDQIMAVYTELYYAEGIGETERVRWFQLADGRLINPDPDNTVYLGYLPLPAVH